MSHYDDLVERALKEAGKKPDVKKSTSRLTTSTRGSEATVYKMHGDLDDPGKIVITRDDYDRYLASFPLFRDRLRSDLTDKTMLFLGFSFSDPHLSFVLSELKNDVDDNMRPHFAIMAREPKGSRTPRQHRYALTRQALRIEDLKRFGVQTLLIDGHDELPSVIQELRLRYLRRQVFVSGAATDFDPMGRSKWAGGAMTSVTPLCSPSDPHYSDGGWKSSGNTLSASDIKQRIAAIEAGDLHGATDGQTYTDVRFMCQTRENAVFSAYQVGGGFIDIATNLDGGDAKVDNFSFLCD